MMGFFWQGLLVGASLIIAIGAQNAYLIKQGLSKQYIATVAGICFLGDVVLMSFSVLGAGNMFAQTPWLNLALTLIGCVFLLVYAYRCFKSAYVGQASLSDDVLINNTSKTHKQVALMAFALTFLNPHVYIDTIVIIGGIATTLTITQKWWFLIGSLSTSLVWFFGVGYGSRLLLPWFSKPKTWQILDASIGVLMLWLASGLFEHAHDLFNQGIFNTLG